MESTSSREHLTSDHALRVLVRIDTQLRLASLEVRGCLTTATYPALVNILTHTGTLGAAVSVNLLRAAHVDGDALELLREGADAAVAPEAAVSPGTLAAGPEQGWSGLPGSAQDGGVPVEILVPPSLPVCRPGPGAAVPEPAGAGRPLSNEEAAERAFRQRDPRILPDRGVQPRK